MREFEVIFLGTGTSHGVPVVGCQCRVCRSNDPRDKRLRTALYIQTPEMSFAVDTPPDFRTQCLREDIVRMDAVVYTHSHTDHILGFDDLRRFCEMEDKAMPIFATERTMKDIQRVFQYAFEDGKVFRTYIRPEPQIITGPFMLGETQIIPVDLPHGRTTTNGFVFSRQGRKLLAYMTDCQAVPELALEAAKGAEVFVVDALRHAPHATHLSLEQALDVSRQVGAGTTYFIHMCHDLGHAATEELLPENVHLAYDGLRIFI